MKKFVNTFTPLVSIMIPNYNHSRYLDECIQSAINQTYPNIEIVVLDNASEDDSVDVAKKYISQGVRVCRNAYNILNGNYKVLANALTSGKYMMLLCADDIIADDFVAKAVQLMETYPTVGYVHGERDFITDEGKVIELDPFFNCSFVAPGRNMMPIYMVTTIAHPSQGIFRRDIFQKIDGYDKEVDHMNADRELWFYLSYESDYGYIQKKMCKIRIGNQTETFATQKNFQHPILCHLTIKEFVAFAKAKGLTSVFNREKEALQTLAKEFLGYAAGMLAQEDYHCAKQYLYYAEVVQEDIVEDEEYQSLLKMAESHRNQMDMLLHYKIDYSVKKRCYSPPEEYMKIEGAE